MIGELGGAGVVALFGAIAHGAYYRNSPVFGHAMGSLPGRTTHVAITFDDGPNPVATPRILDTLHDEGVTATFFLLGKYVDRWPALAQRIANEGHTVANHGWHHRKLHVRGPAYVRDDIERGTTAIVKATGVAPEFFRAPHGFRSPWVNRVAARFGQRVVGWSLGVWDSALPGSLVIAERSVSGARAGSILLLHDGDGYNPAGDRAQTAEALPHIIRGLRDRKLEPISLARALDAGAISRHR